METTTATRFLVKVRMKGETVTRFHRLSRRSAVRVLALLWVEFPNASQIEVEVAK